MHGKGRFWDPRLNDSAQLPIAAANGFGDLRLPSGEHISPDDDMITSKLQALQFYQLAIPSPQPPAGASIQRQPPAAMNYSAGRRSAITAMLNRSGPTQAGTYTLRPKSVSIASRLTVRRITAIELHPSVICLGT
jgi:hypothetical protein